MRPLAQRALLTLAINVQGAVVSRTANVLQDMLAVHKAEQLVQVSNYNSSQIIASESQAR